MRLAILYILYCRLFVGCLSYSYGGYQRWRSFRLLSCPLSSSPQPHVRGKPQHNHGRVWQLAWLSNAEDIRARTQTDDGRTQCGTWDWPVYVSTKTDRGAVRHNFHCQTRRSAKGTKGVDCNVIYLRRHHSIVAVWSSLVSCCVPAGSDSSSRVGGSRGEKATLQAPSEWLSHIGECRMYSHDHPHVWLHSLPCPLPLQSFMQIEKAFRFDNASVIVTPYFCFGSLLVCHLLQSTFIIPTLTSLPPPPGPGECPLEITIEKHDARDDGGLLHSGDHLSCGHPPPMWNTACWYQARQLHAQEHNVSVVGGVRCDMVWSSYHATKIFF